MERANALPTNTLKHCENEPRIIQLENRLDYKEEKIEQLIQDNRDIRKDINQLTISVTELTNTLKIREEDIRKIDQLEKDVERLQSTINTIIILLPILCSIVTLIFKIIRV